MINLYKDITMNPLTTVNKDFAKDTALEIIKTAQLSSTLGNIQLITQLLIARSNRGMREIFSVDKDSVISDFKNLNIDRPATNACYRVCLLKVIGKSESEWLREHEYYIDQLNVEYPHEKAPKVKLEIPPAPSLSDNIFDRVDSFAQFLKDNSDARDYWGRRYESFLS